LSAEESEAVEFYESTKYKSDSWNKCK
jgi:hypothetical protein